MKNNKVKWYGKIPTDCTWLTFVKIVGKGYEYSNDLKNIIVTSDDNKGLPDDILVQTLPSNQHAIRKCTIHFKQEKVDDNPILTKDILVTQDGINETCVENVGKPTINYDKSILRVEPKSGIITFYKGEFNGIKAYLKPYYVQKTVTKYCGTNEIISTNSTENFGEEINVSNDPLCNWQVNDGECSINNGLDSVSLLYAQNSKNEEKHITITASYNNKLNDTCSLIQGVSPTLPSEDNYFYEVRTNVENANVVFSSKITEFEKIVQTTKENNYYKARIELPKNIAEKNAPIVANITNKLPETKYSDINLLIATQSNPVYLQDNYVKNIVCDSTDVISLSGKCYVEKTEFKYNNNNVEIQPNQLLMITSASTISTKNIAYKGRAYSEDLKEYNLPTLSTYSNWTNLTYKINKNETKLKREIRINYESEEVNGKRANASVLITQDACKKEKDGHFYINLRILDTQDPMKYINPIVWLKITYEIGGEEKTKSFKNLSRQYYKPDTKSEYGRYLIHCNPVISYDVNDNKNTTITVKKIAVASSRDSFTYIDVPTFSFEYFNTTRQNFEPLSNTTFPLEVGNIDMLLLMPNLL